MKYQGLLGYFPWEIHPQIRENQRQLLELIDKNGGSVTAELPVGSGKTAIGYTFLKALVAEGKKTLFYIAPTKAIVDQVQQMFPGIGVVYGRNEHPCLYYPGKEFRADEIPCSLLADCEHRVDRETGQTKEPSSKPCPYLWQRFWAKRGGIVVSTMSFYLFTQLFQEQEKPAGLVIDEAHKMAKVVRGSLRYEITDSHLDWAIRIIRKLGAVSEANSLQGFRETMVKVIRLKSQRTPVLLEAAEIRELMDSLLQVRAEALWRLLNEAVATGKIDTITEHLPLKQLEVLVRDLRRYLHSFEYSLERNERKPLNYTVAYCESEAGENKKPQHKLVVQSYYVAPLIKKILGERTLAYSATIGDPEVFRWETGINNPFYTFSSDFPAANTRIFLPTDTPNLAVKERSRQQPTRVLRHIAVACRCFAEKGNRSLVVVVSEKERQKFLWLCQEEGVEAVSYGNGRPAKEMVAQFKKGQGDVLVGTVANYGEGIDLPHQIAPVIFFLRPAYPRPGDPASQFEEKRFGGGQRWRIWNWRVMIEALQVRGRNIRSDDAVGVTFFISQQFRRFLWAALPQELKGSYEGDKTFEQCVVETMELVEKR